MTKVTDRYLEERRAEILEAAKRVFVRKGYGSATIQDIASEADVAAGSIYRYYPGKADLIGAVAERSAYDDHVLFSGFDHETAPASPLAALLASGEQIRRSLHESEGVDLCVLRMESGLAAFRDEEVSERVRPHIRETRAMLEQAIADAQAAGELDPDVDASAVAGLIHAFVAGSSALRISLDEEAGIDDAWVLMTRLLSTLFTPEFAARLGALSSTASPASEASEG
jgi:TetR/AcrR family transcriptional regulator, transcriptional repressor of aconitase